MHSQTKTHKMLKHERTLWKKFKVFFYFLRHSKLKAFIFTFVRFMIFPPLAVSFVLNVFLIVNTGKENCRTDTRHFCCLLLYVTDPRAIMWECLFIANFVGGCLRGIDKARCETTLVDRLYIHTSTQPYIQPYIQTYILANSFRIIDKYYTAK